MSMSLQSNTKNPYIIQFHTFETPTACNCSDDCTCEQCVSKNTSSVSDFMRNFAGAARDVVQTPFKVVSAIGNSVKMSKETAERIATKWRFKGAIRNDDTAYKLAVATLLANNGERDARNELRSMNPPAYFTEQDREASNLREKQELKQIHAETVEQEKHNSVLSGIMHRRNQEKLQQQRAEEIQKAHHKSLFGMFGHNKPAAVSNTPASSHSIMPHFSVTHPRVYNTPASSIMPHSIMPHSIMPHSIMPRFSVSHHQVPFSHVSHVTMPRMPLLQNVSMPGRMHEACILSTGTHDTISKIPEFNLYNKDGWLTICYVNEAVSQGLRNERDGWYWLQDPIEPSKSKFLGNFIKIVPKPTSGFPHFFNIKGTNTEETTFSFFKICPNPIADPAKHQLKNFKIFLQETDPERKTFHIAPSLDKD